MFELLFGLTNANVLDMQSELNDLNGQVAEANREAETINQFLTHSGMKLRIDAELALAQAIKEEKEGQTYYSPCERGQRGRRPRDPGPSQVLTDSERALNDAQELVSSLDREESQYRAERHQVGQDIARLRQMASAGQRLANIEFVVCPRCTQSLTQRPVPDDVCRVCLQHDNVKNLPRGQYRTPSSPTRSKRWTCTGGHREARQRRSRSCPEPPEPGSFSDHPDREPDREPGDTPPPGIHQRRSQGCPGKAQQERLEEVLQRWDRASDLQTVAETLESQRSALKTAIGAAKSTLEERRRDVLSQLTNEFATTVAAFRIPASQGATIDPKTYLPLLDGQPFNQVSSAGGIATATQVAYWMSLIAVATRLNDTAYPAFLMIDSPRLAVSSTEDISGQMYSRFVTQVGVVPDRLQFIVADDGMRRTSSVSLLSSSSHTKTRPSARSSVPARQTSSLSQQNPTPRHESARRSRHSACQCSGIKLGAQDVVLPSRNQLVETGSVTHRFECLAPCSTAT